MNFKSTTRDTGIIIPSSENSRSTSLSTEVPSNMFSTNTVLTASADSSGDFAPTTMMSLADRLKFAMSSSSFKKTTTERTRRLSKKPQVQTAPSVNRQKSTISDSGSSLATRFNSVTTERARHRKVTLGLQNSVASITEEPKVVRTSFRPASALQLETSSAPSNSGVMSLAELLALSNKAKTATKPPSRATARRRTTPSRNRFSDQVAEASSGTTEIIVSSSPRLRFRGNSQPPGQEFDYDSADDRRIPVRKVDELPKVKFNFPMRKPISRPSSFRTTADPSLTITENPTQTTLTSSLDITKTTRRRFIPSSTPPTIILIESAASPPKEKKVVESSAEQSCPELQCIDGACIAISQLNDGVIDCSDGSDEQDFGGLVT